MSLTNEDKQWITGQLAELDTQFRRNLEVVLNHTQAIGGQLHTQLQETENRIVSRFAPVEARLERHGGLLRGGSVQIDRIVEWSEKIDGIIARQQQEINDLKRRLEMP